MPPRDPCSCPWSAAPSAAPLAMLRRPHIHLACLPHPGAAAQPQHAMVTMADQRRDDEEPETTQSRSTALLALLACDTSTDYCKVTLLCLSSRL